MIENSLEKKKIMQSQNDVPMHDIVHKMLLLDDDDFQLVWLLIERLSSQLDSN